MFVFVCWIEYCGPLFSHDSEQYRGEHMQIGYFEQKELVSLHKFIVLEYQNQSKPFTINQNIINYNNLQLVDLLKLTRYVKYILTCFIINLMAPII